MLKGISPLLSPDLLKTLHEMGHGDEILLADAHFPGHTIGQRTLRADGLMIAPLMDAILVLLELDWTVNPLTMMQPDQASDLDPAVEAEYMRAIRKHSPQAAMPLRIDRDSFYRNSKSAYAILMTGEMRPYGNILLRKGVTQS